MMKKVFLIILSLYTLMSSPIAMACVGGGGGGFCHSAPQPQPRGRVVVQQRTVVRVAMRPMHVPSRCHTCIRRKRASSFAMALSIGGIFNLAIASSNSWM